MDAMDEIVREFVVESYENLDRLDRDLVDLESDGESRSLMGSIFRTIHTIKGTSGFLGFGALESLTHVGENLLAELRDGKRPMTQRTTDVLLQMVDSVRVILDVIEKTGAEGVHDTSAVVAAIQQVLDSEPGADAPPATVDEAPVQAVKKPRIGKRPAAKTATPAAAASAPAEADMPAPEASPQAAPVDPAPADALPTPAPAPGPAPAPAPARDGEESHVRSAAESSIRVDVEVLDALMRHVGELVLARNAMTSLATEMDDATLVRASQRLSLIATELQQGVMKTRMQPIDHVWSKVPRMVRDVSTALGRRVKLEMIGKDTELDRSVLEAIKDPLTHLIRNAIDHGIEVPEARDAAGKPAQGIVTLRAYHQGGQVVVEVSDDGKGIDPQTVAAKAVQKGLRTAEQVAALGTQDILQMLFLPGFSTAETVTNVSGRGVGMDVVKTKIDAIGGVVDVQSTPGVGTTWRLRIPLTLAIMPALTVECADEIYAIPQVNLLELLAIDDAQTGLDQVGDAPVYRLRGQLLPLVDLRDVLGRPARETVVGAVIAVMQADGGRFGLIIDQVRNTEEIVAKPIGASIKRIGIYAGATLLGDGSVTLILDIPAVARRALEQQETLPDLQQQATVDTDTEQMLVVSVGEDRQLAMPLGAVTRLERCPADVLEQVGGSLVMQYRGRITPVVDLASLLGTGRPASDELAVVVCARGDRAVALVAKEVVDIVDCADLDRSEVSGAALLGSIVVKGKVTELLDLSRAVTSADPSFYDAHEPELVGAGSDR
ncbi:chemotaxis protein CheW [Demequina aestuarii]|uniref:chemotaxis protein CheW n=1 Tax=Demequina aestuarii TaxID=327095 RepID=UPI0007813CA8|nr:chemotaxis protein CheW [Demequina aestuarii]